VKRNIFAKRTGQDFRPRARRANHQRNPLWRSDANTSMSETFAYDGLNRLTSATVNLTPTPLAKTFSYSPIGNLLSKSDVGTYSYPAAGSPQPHAVMSVSGGLISTADPNGNQTAGLGHSISYSSYNKPSSITQGTRTISFLDDTEHQRFKQVTPEGSTLYISAFGVLAELANPGASGQKWTEYLSVGNAKVGMRSLQTASETLTTRYFHTDHLGSISVITDANGLVVERLSFDAWGKRRHPDGTDDTTGSITSQSTRGFTGEEELSVAGLVHLNGRVYDPLLARMTSADPTVTDPMNPQGWNRYSYVGNDPLAFTDPNGFSWLSSFFKSVTNFFKSNPIAKAILQIASTIILNAILPGSGVLLAVASAAGGAAIATGLSGGNLGQILRASAIAGATAFAFFEVGSLTYGPAHASPGFDSPNFNAANYAENIAGHALVGCASSAASGGSCKSGALSGAVGSAMAPLTSSAFPNARTDIGQRIGGTIMEATAGGLASIAGGGKFANGAVTGAFGYLFNDLMVDAKGKLTYVPSKIGSELDVYEDFAANPEHTYPLAIPAAVAGVYATAGAVEFILDALYYNGTTAGRVMALHDLMAEGNSGAAYQTMLGMAQNPAGQVELAEMGKLATGLIQVATTHEQVTILSTIASMATTLGRPLP
jgi:RHS repeat-associated protein